MVFDPPQTLFVHRDREYAVSGSVQRNKIEAPISLFKHLDGGCKKLKGHMTVSKNTSWNMSLAAEPENKFSRYEIDEEMSRWRNL